MFCFRFSSSWMANKAAATNFGETRNKLNEFSLNRIKRKHFLVNYVKIFSLQNTNIQRLFFLHFQILNMKKKRALVVCSVSCRLLCVSHYFDARWSTKITPFIVHRRRNHIFVRWNLFPFGFWLIKTNPIDSLKMRRTSRKRKRKKTDFDSVVCEVTYNQTTY